MPQPKFISKPMSEMTTQEWESLCDGCGLCCQIRVQDIDTDEIALSNVACRYLCLDSHQCKDYENRQKNVPDCIKITPDNVHEMNWLPYTCGYRVVARKQKLPHWHPLVCGKPEQVHKTGASMKGELVSEDEADWDF
jgi:uncharacterized cysteine cluster protein YcgN (CxxCxxCC family)